MRPPALRSWAAQEGTPSPLGVTWIESEQAYNSQEGNYWEDLTFTVQEGQAGQWRRVIDTALDSPADFCEPGAEVPLTSAAYLVRGRSMVALVRPRR